MKRKISSIEELKRHSDNGAKVSCSEISYLKKPVKAELLMKFSCESLMKAIAKGLYAHGVPESASQESVLFSGQAAIRATGLSHSEIAEKVGVTRRAVGLFLNAESVQTRVLDKYLKALDLCN